MKKALLILAVALTGAVSYANASIPACRPGSSPSCPCQSANFVCPPSSTSVQ